MPAPGPSSPASRLDRGAPPRPSIASLPRRRQFGMLKPARSTSASGADPKARNGSTGCWLTPPTAMASPRGPREDQRRDAPIRGAWSITGTRCSTSHRLTFFNKCAMKRQGQPRTAVTDGLRSYGAATKQILASSRQGVGRWLNNRLENSHPPFRRREQAMARKTLRQFAAGTARPQSLLSGTKSGGRLPDLARARARSLEPWPPELVSCSWVPRPRPPGPPNCPSARRTA
jgi:hypothetical protein